MKNEFICMSLYLLRNFPFSLLCVCVCVEAMGDGSGWGKLWCANWCWVCGAPIGFQLGLGGLISSVMG